MFDRLDFVARYVKPLDIEEEIKKIKSSDTANPEKPEPEKPEPEKPEEELSEDELSDFDIDEELI